ncbi:MAG: hypothetical protein AAF497_10645 [Planctomycetota bacterium]
MFFVPCAAPIIQEHNYSDDLFYRQPDFVATNNGLATTRLIQPVHPEFDAFEMPEGLFFLVTAVVC